MNFLFKTKKTQSVPQPTQLDQDAKQAWRKLLGDSEAHSLLAEMRIGRVGLSRDRETGQLKTDSSADFNGETFNIYIAPSNPSSAVQAIRAATTQSLASSRVPAIPQPAKIDSDAQQAWSDFRNYLEGCSYSLEGVQIGRVSLSRDRATWQPKTHGSADFKEGELNLYIAPFNLQSTLQAIDKALQRSQSYPRVPNGSPTIREFNAISDTAHYYPVLQLDGFLHANLPSLKFFNELFKTPDKQLIIGNKATGEGVWYFGDPGMSGGVGSPNNYAQKSFQITCHDNVLRLAPTAEHAYHMGKTDDPSLLNQMSVLKTPSEVRKFAGSNIAIAALKTNGWFGDNGKGVQWMRQVAKTRIEQDPVLKQNLIYFASRYPKGKMIEYATHDDTTWAMKHEGRELRGKNQLGEIYMREALELAPSNQQAHSPQSSSYRTNYRTNQPLSRAGGR